MTDELAASIGGLTLGERQPRIASSSYRYGRRSGREHTSTRETMLCQSVFTTSSVRANDPEAARNSRAVREAANLYLQAALPGQRMNTKQQREVLPICEHEDEIVQYIASHRVTCVQGETGCGKSSMVPQFLLEHCERNSPSYVKCLPPKAAREYQANIVVTQPRRLAAKTLAQRVASDLGEEIGETVGYAIARDTKRSANTRITYVTTGYLLQLLVSRPESFQRYSHVILDEIHERQIDSDLLSLVIKLCMAEHCKTKVIVMSATLQGKLFSRYFSESATANTHRRGASIQEPIFVGARRYPVDEIYLEKLLRLRDLTSALSANDIKSIVKAWISFDAKNSPDLAEDILQHIRTVNHPDLLKERELNMEAIYFAVRKQRSKDLWPQIQDGLLEVGEKLITTFSNPGETTLVFLPGMADIQEMYENLEPYETNPRTKKIHIFVLHSQISSHFTHKKSFHRSH